MIPATFNLPLSLLLLLVSLSLLIVSCESENVTRTDAQDTESKLKPLEQGHAQTHHLEQPVSQSVVDKLTSPMHSQMITITSLRIEERNASDLTNNQAPTERRAGEEDFPLPLMKAKNTLSSPIKVSSTQSVAGHYLSHPLTQMTSRDTEKSANYHFLHHSGHSSPLTSAKSESHSTSQSNLPHSPRAEATVDSPNTYKDFIQSAHQRTLSTLYGHINDQGFFVPATDIASSPHSSPIHSPAGLSYSSSSFPSSPSSSPSLSSSSSYLNTFSSPHLQSQTAKTTDTPSNNIQSSRPFDLSQAPLLYPSSASPFSPFTSTSHSPIQPVSSQPVTSGHPGSILIGETLSSAMNRQLKQTKEQHEQLQQQQQVQREIKNPNHQEYQEETEERQRSPHNVNDVASAPSASLADERMSFWPPPPPPHLHGAPFPGYNFMPLPSAHHQLPHYPPPMYMSPLHAMYHNTLPHHQLQQLANPFMSPMMIPPPAYFSPAMSGYYGDHYDRSAADSARANKHVHSSNSPILAPTSLVHLPGGVYSTAASHKRPSVHPVNQPVTSNFTDNTSPGMFPFNYKYPGVMRSPLIEHTLIDLKEKQSSSTLPDAMTNEPGKPFSSSHHHHQLTPNNFFTHQHHRQRTFFPSSKMHM